MNDSYLQIADGAAREAGALLREHYGSQMLVNEAHQYDIKLELDVRSQKLISERILAACPDHRIRGEEGDEGQEGSEFEWVVDPIDGTVNFFYGIPHFAVSIALRQAGRTILGVIHDPMRDETWTATSDDTARLNGRPIRVSERGNLDEAVITVGFAKSKASLDAGMERYRALAYRVRKIRTLGSAALALTYIASGRLDAYIEEQISLWDIAAGHLILEKAGGRVDLEPRDDTDTTFSIRAWNGRLPIPETLAAISAVSAGK